MASSIPGDSIMGDSIIGSIPGDSIAAESVTPGAMSETRRYCCPAATTSPNGTKM